jgi:hypothetical protein
MPHQASKKNKGMANDNTDVIVKLPSVNFFVAEISNASTPACNKNPSKQIRICNFLFLNKKIPINADSATATVSNNTKKLVLLVSSSNNWLGLLPLKKESFKEAPAAAAANKSQMVCIRWIII